jgi:vacuolar iron transporter family protein
MSQQISNIVYGGIDGTITTFAVMAGAIGSNVTGITVAIIALASLFSDGFSMGVSSYESVIDEKIEDPIIKGLVTFISFVAIGMIPIMVYYYYQDEDNSTRFNATTISAMITLFLIGMFKEFTTDKDTNALELFGSGLKTMVLGALASGIAYYVANTLTVQLEEKNKQQTESKEDSLLTEENSS